MTAEFRDESGAERLRGSILIGGTTGQVATVQADGTLAPAAAASGQASYAIVSRATSAVTVNSATVVSFNTVKIDADGYWDAGAHQFVVPVGKGGVFYVEFGILGDNSALATGAYAELGNSGPDPNMQAPLVNVDGGTWKGAGGSTVRLADADTVACSLVLFTAAAMDVDVGSHFSISRLGGA